VLGIQAWMQSQVTDFTLDALSDMTPLSDIAAEADQAGAFVVGGGVPKNYVLQTMLVSPDAYDFAVQLTMDTPQTGGLSARDARRGTLVGQTGEGRSQRLRLRRRDHHAAAGGRGGQGEDGVAGIDQRDLVVGPQSMPRSSPPSPSFFRSASTAP